MPNHIFKINKALYGLKQTLRAWYERLNNLLLENNFKRDTTLFRIDPLSNFILIQVYVDNIIYSAIDDILCKDFPYVN